MGATRVKKSPSLQSCSVKICFVQIPARALPMSVGSEECEAAGQVGGHGIGRDVPGLTQAGGLGGRTDSPPRIEAGSVLGRAPKA